MCQLRNYRSIRLCSTFGKRPTRQTDRMESIRFQSSAFNCHNQKDIRWDDASAETLEPPNLRLAELFNVNHIILSHANPYKLAHVTEKLIPKAPGFVSTFAAVAVNEIWHRLSQVSLTLLLICH